MNKRLALLVNVIVILASLAGTAVCAIQFAVAVRFLELGRVLLYFLLTSLCIETLVFSVIRLVKDRK